MRHGTISLPGLTASRPVRTGSTNTLESESTPAWISLTLLNSFTNYGSGWATAAYRKYSSGIVEVRGLVKRTTTPSAATAIGTLPTGFRPTATRMFPVIANGMTGVAIGSIYIAPDGNIAWQSGATSEYFSIEFFFGVD